MQMHTHAHTHTHINAAQKHTYWNHLLTFEGRRDKSKTEGTLIIDHYIIVLPQNTISTLQWWSKLEFDKHVTFSPPTRNRSTAARLILSFSHKPESTSLMEMPGLMGTEQHEPSGRLMLQWRTARSDNDMELRDTSPCQTEEHKGMNNANKWKTHKKLNSVSLNWR